MAAVINLVHLVLGVLLIPTASTFHPMPTTTSFFNTLWQRPVSSCRDCLVFPMESEGGYFVDDVPCAAKITSMQILSEGSRFGTCKRGVSYGFFGARAWTDLGCRATFRFCFVEGTVHDVKCESDRYRPRTCRLRNPCNKIESLSLTWAYSDAPCIQGHSYSIDREGIHVSKGCRAKFQVGCRECGIHSSRNAQVQGQGQNQGQDQGQGHVQDRGLPFFNDPFNQFN